jgi:hypothetical protein
MGSVWIKIEDIQSRPWAMSVVSSVEDATLISSGDAQQTAQRAAKELSRYDWELVSTYLRGTFLLQGFLKYGRESSPR